MIDTQAIRSKILDLAMRGKLTEQLPEDGTAEGLVATSTNPKTTRLLATPFEIPNSWRWTSIEKLTTPVGKKADQIYANDVKDSGKYPAISQGEQLIDGYTDEEKAIVDLPVIIFGDHTKNVKFVDFPFVICADGTKCLKASSQNNPKFVFYWMKYASCAIEDRGYARHFSLLKKHPVSLPPLAEQHRIVARIEQAFAALDTIDALQAKYADNLAVLKSKLIDAAIRGKLTDQLPEDGTAEELYRQIQAEKQSLIKAGKIKKEKPLPEIAVDEIPFDIPKSWKWVRTGDVFSVGTGLTPLTNEKRFYENGRIPWVTSSLTSNRYIQDATTYLSEYALEATSLRLHPEHTLIIAMYGEGKTRGQIAELLMPATTNQACATLDNIVYNQATVDYVFFFFRHNYVQLRSQAGGSNQPNLNLNKIKETLIPLPPLAEQKRIVNRLTELLAVCDEFRNVQ